MKKNPILKNYCVLYSLTISEPIDDKVLFEHIPNYCSCELEQELYESKGEKMFDQNELCKTGVIQAYSITEAEIKMMEWIDSFFKKKDNWFIDDEASCFEGFYFFRYWMEKYAFDIDFIYEYYRQYLDINNIEVFKAVDDLFFQMFDSKNREYNDFIDFDYNNNKDSNIVNKFNLFSEKEKHFFKLWIHRWRFNLFYIETPIKI